MKSILFLLALLISSVAFCQKNYKPLFGTESQKSCVILKNDHNVPNLNLNLPSITEKNKNIRIAASAGILAFEGIMTINYCTSTNEKFKGDRLGYFGLMTALTAGLITVQIVL